MGRHERRNNSDLPHLQPEAVEEAVARYWQGEVLRPEVGQELRVALKEDLTTTERHSDRERRALRAKIRELRQERYRWAEKAMAGAVPDDIAQEKQASLGKQLTNAEMQLNAFDVSIMDVSAIVDACLDLAEHGGEAYRASGPQLRRDWNQTWWEWLDIDVADDEPKVRDGTRTPLMEAIRTAEMRGSYPGPALQGRSRDARVHSNFEGSRVNTLVEVMGLEPTTSTLRT